MQEIGNRKTIKNRKNIKEKNICKVIEIVYWHCLERKLYIKN